MIVKFREWTCNVVLKSYSNGRVAIQLKDIEDGSPIATASVNIPGIDMQEGWVAIKDYSENQGMLEALIEAGVVSTPILEAVSQHVRIPICLILI